MALYSSAGFGRGKPVVCHSCGRLSRLSHRPRDLADGFDPRAVLVDGMQHVSITEQCLHHGAGPTRPASVATAKCGPPLCDAWSNAITMRPEMLGTAAGMRRIDAALTHSSAGHRVVPS